MSQTQTPAADTIQFNTEQPSYYGIRIRGTKRNTSLFTGPYESVEQAMGVMTADAKTGDRLVVVLAEVVSDKSVKVGLV